MEKIEEDIDQPAPAAKTFKRKALLIGVQTVREDTGSPVRSPVSAKIAGIPRTQSIKAKWVKKRQEKLNALRGPHRDVRAMRDLLISELRRDSLMHQLLTSLQMCIHTSQRTLLSS